MIQKIKDKIFEISQRWGKKIRLDLPYFVRNGYWVFLRQLVGTICGSIVSITFARLASKEVFGQYQLFLSILSIVSIFSIPGLNTAVMQAVARGKDGEYKKAVKTSFLGSFLGIPVLMIVGLYYTFNGQTMIGHSLILGSIFFPFIYAPNTWDYFFQGKSRFDLSTKYFSWLTIYNTLSTVTIFLLFRNNLKTIVLGYVISYAFFNSFYFLKSLKFIKNSEYDSETRKYGFYITKLKILELVAGNIDKILLATILSPSSLAVYSVISLIPTKAKNLVKPFVNIFFPKMAGSDQTLSSVLRSKKKTLLIFSATLLFLAVAYFFAIEPMNKLFFGENYSEYYSLSRLYVVLVLIFLPLNILGRYVQAVRNYKVLFLTNAVYPIIQIIINFIFIFKWGILGAVLAYNLDTVIWLLIYIYGLFLSKKTA